MKRINAFIILFYFIGLSSTIAQVDLDSGLVAKYYFNRNANDESGNGNNGTLYGPTLLDDRFGNTNKSYLFNEDGDCIILPNTFDFLPKTISLWFNTAETIYHPSYGSIYQSDNPNLLYGSVGIAIKNIDEKNKLLLTISGVTDTVDIVPDNWYNVAIVTDTTKEIKYFINGELVGNKTFVNNAVSVNGLEKTVIGSSRTASNHYYKGIIDDIRIYNRVLNIEEIQELHNESLCYQNIIAYDTTFVTVTDTTFITVTDTTFVIVTDTLKIDVILSELFSPNNLNTLKIYPNPANSYIYIDNGNFSLMEGYSIRIVNLSGQTVFHSEINEQQFYIELSGWTGHGLYLVSLIDKIGNTIDIKKIILQ